MTVSRGTALAKFLAYSLLNVVYGAWMSYEGVKNYYGLAYDEEWQWFLFALGLMYLIYNQIKWLIYISEIKVIRSWSVTPFVAITSLFFGAMFFGWINYAQIHYYLMSPPWVLVIFPFEFVIGFSGVALCFLYLLKRVLTAVFP